MHRPHPQQSKIWLPLVIAMALTGCGIINDTYHPAEVKPPEHWKETPSQETAPAWPAADWWTQFNSPQLTSFIEEAKSANDDIQASVARVQQADAQARVVGAALLPTIDASAGVTHVRQPPGISVPCVKERTANCLTGSLNASYELDFWGKNESASESAHALAQASRFDQEIVALTVTSGVADSYFSVVGLRDRLAVARGNVANGEHVLDNIQKRFDHGLAPALDLAQQKTLVATLRAAVPPLELQLRQQINALVILLGRTPEALDIPESDGLTAITLPAVTPGLPSELLTRRPDIQLAEAQLIAANADINSARAAMFPSITLTAGDGYASTALATLLKPESAFYNLGSSLLQPIFRGGALMGALDVRKARYDELLHDYHKAVIAAFSDVENALAAVAQTDAEQKAQEEAQHEAKNAYDLAQKQFTSGLISIDTLLNTQRALFAANDALSQAKLSHLQALVGLYKALGGGWQGKAA